MTSNVSSGPDGEGKFHVAIQEENVAELSEMFPEVAVRPLTQFEFDLISNMQRIKHEREDAPYQEAIAATIAKHAA
jgi:hypothetical protein